VVSRIAADKVAKFEGWGNQKHDPGATMGAIFDRLSQLEGKVQLEVTVERTPTIDVTPSGSRP